MDRAEEVYLLFICESPLCAGVVQSTLCALCLSVHDDPNEVQALLLSPFCRGDAGGLA